MNHTNSTQIRFGWFIPTAGDTTAIGDPSAEIPASMEMFERVALAAEDAGFEYALVPVQTACFEAWVSCAMIVARTRRLKMLVAARPGFMVPTLTAKMISTFDQLSKGRIYINLIAGGGAAEMAADGCFLDHDARFEVMDETVALMKRVWTEAGPVTHAGKHFRVDGAIVRPRPYQAPHPPFFLGGMSDAAKEVSAKHSDVHLFWGDTPERIAVDLADIRERAARHGRADKIGFGMRLQVIIREREEDAWAAAARLIASASENHKRMIEELWEQSECNSRMKQLGKAEGYMLRQICGVASPRCARVRALPSSAIRSRWRGPCRNLWILAARIFVCRGIRMIRKPKDLAVWLCPISVRKRLLLLQNEAGDFSADVY